MNEQTEFSSPDSIDNFGSTFIRNTQSVLSSEESGTRILYDYNTSDTFYEIDVNDLNLTLYPDEFFREIFESIGALEPKSDEKAIMDSLCEVLTEEPRTLDPLEPNDMEDGIQSTDEHLLFTNSGTQDLTHVRPHVEKLAINDGSVRPIELSDSVAVIPPIIERQLKILHPLENTYRARYKSDYFPQTGMPRRPRYVADQNGRHHITVQMPTEYNCELKNKYLRVALITTAVNGEYYYSPYKFQTNHNDLRVPDENPIYLPVKSHLMDNSIMKLQLVLIKSKLDKLVDAQPLKIFSDTINDIKNIISDEKLAPKDLINKYQLDKSHIAFTLCTKAIDGSYETHPETTVISSVITESSTKKKIISTNEINTRTPEKGREVCCPECSYRFNIDDTNIKPPVRKRAISSGETNRKKKTIMEQVK